MELQHHDKKRYKNKIHKKNKCTDLYVNHRNRITNIRLQGLLTERIFIKYNCCQFLCKSTNINKKGT